jgi:hypothetical protein
MSEICAPLPGSPTAGRRRPGTPAARAGSTPGRCAGRSRPATTGGPAVVRPSTFSSRSASSSATSSSVTCTYGTPFGYWVSCITRPSSPYLSTHCPDLRSTITRWPGSTGGSPTTRAGPSHRGRPQRVIRAGRPPPVAHHELLRPVPREQGGDPRPRLQRRPHLRAQERQRARSLPVEPVAVAVQLRAQRRPLLRPGQRAARFTNAFSSPHRLVGHARPVAGSSPPGYSTAATSSRSSGNGSWPTIAYRASRLSSRNVDSIPSPKLDGRQK